MENTVNGGDLMLFMGTQTLAFATSHKLSISVETVDTSSKDHGAWTNKAAKKISWNISCDNLYLEKGDTHSAGFGDLYDKMLERKPIDVVFTNATNIPSDGTGIPTAGWTANTTNTYSGKVIITSLELNAPNGENATCSIQMEGASALEHNKQDKKIA